MNYYRQQVENANRVASARIQEAYKEVSDVVIEFGISADNPAQKVLTKLSEARCLLKEWMQVFKKEQNDQQGEAAEYSQYLRLKEKFEKKEIADEQA